MDVRWTLDLGTALKPDQARYQGHHATSVENGFESDGRQYRASHERPNMDAFVNLPLTAIVAIRTFSHPMGSMGFRHRLVLAIL